MKKHEQTGMIETYRRLKRHAYMWKNGECLRQGMEEAVTVTDTLIERHTSRKTDKGYR